ncbi:MAG TPA: DUF6798 domain-containing protein, partial [Silvibacterium sp.]|nr:DUF6798 domain-containing protein [Silvibacterium sp.]
RSYLFPSEWKWFEYLGLGVPLLIFALTFGHLGINRGCPIRARGWLEWEAHTLISKLCLTVLILGTCTALATLLFVHPSSPGFLARLQLLRAFHIVYLVGILLFGGFIGQTLWATRLHRLAAFAVLASAAVLMFLTARLTYRASDHIEFPGLIPRNPWQQAFLWIRDNTPSDAVFATNPDLVLLRGEDAQGFRAITGRSLLADYKDEGLAVIFPHLAPQWAIEYNAQKDIDQFSDRDRLTRLRPLAATWILLSRNAATSLSCPWHNSVAQVCRLVLIQK